MDKKEKIIYFLTLTQEEKRVIIFLIASLLVGSTIIFFEKMKGPLIPSQYLESKDKEKSIMIDVNRATVRELIRLPGIGPSLAKRIVELREKKGSFRQIEELLEVRGIGKKTLEKIKPYIYLGERR